MGRSGVTAAARIGVEPGRATGRISWSQAWPLLLRATGADRVHLVHGAGGPLGGDAFALDIELAAATALTVRSAAATLVQPGRDPAAPARWRVGAVVGPGARLDWAPEPTIVCAGARIESAVRVEVGPGGRAGLREIVVLGRHGEVGGRYRGTLELSVQGEPVLVHTTVLDGADPALTGPAGTAGARAVGTLVVTGTAPDGAGERAGVRWAWTALDGPAAMLIAVGDPAPVAAVLDGAILDGAILDGAVLDGAAADGAADGTTRSAVTTR